jgi:hypothetical protein
MFRFNAGVELVQVVLNILLKRIATKESLCQRTQEGYRKEEIERLTYKGNSASSDGVRRLRV